MMRKINVVGACLCSLMLGADAGAQVVSQERVVISGPPAEGMMQLPGMPGRQFKTGTGRIRGRIVSSDSGGPVRRAQVRATGPEIAAKTAMTDAEGRYEFKDLPAGRYNLTVSKAGYVQVSFGQLRPFESGKPIELADAQVLDRADISMPRGSVIAGRILDEFGDPVADSVVSAMRSSWSNGRRRLQATGRTAQTNDLGQYRIYGLPPGDYYVSATLRSGGAEMAAIEMAMAASAAAGAGAGSAGWVGGGPSGSSPASGYAPTYFPGTTSGSDAQKLTIAVGQEAQGTDFALLPVRLARITGTVIGSDGKPAEGTMVNATPRVLDNAGMIIPATARTDKNGNFTLNSLAPGDYNLQTRGMQIMTSGGGDNMVFTARVTMGGPDGGESEFGSVPVSVAGEDVSSVVIVTSKGATAQGHLTFEGGTKPTTATQVRIIATPVDNEGPMMMGPGGMGTVKEDGSFELKGMAGTRLIRAAGLPPGWVLKGVRVNGAELTDTGVEFKPGEAVSGLEVVVTQKTTEVSGTVKTASGDPAKDYTLVVFSDQPQLWTVPSSRHVTGIRPDQEGRFQLKNMPPGGYYAIALEYIPQGEWGDPDVLDRLKAQATRFSLTEGATKSLDLKLQQ
jgi:protocatechuate 3,4-dioxygenase beta subunit